MRRKDRVSDAGVGERVSGGVDWDLNCKHKDSVERFDDFRRRKSRQNDGFRV